MSFTDFNDLPSPTGIDPRTGMVRYGEDRNMFVVFYQRSVEDPIASKQAGRRICKGGTYIKIQPPGERLTVIDRPVTEDDKRRWPSQWQHFERNHEGALVEGTPIDLLYPDHPEVADMLRGSAVHTIEQCAALSGLAIESIGMGAQEYVNRAKKYLEHSAKGVAFHQHSKDLAERDQKIRLLENSVRLLQDTVDKLQGMLNRSTSPFLNQAVPMQTMDPRQPVTGAVQGVPIPGRNPDGLYDVQSMQIAASHPTNEIAQRKNQERSEKMKAAWARRKAREAAESE
jgi:hypothetical protein